MNTFKSISLFWSLALLVFVTPFQVNAAPPELAQIKAAAEAGDPLSQVHMGNEYARKFEFAKAEGFYRSAAQAGLLEGQVALADLLLANHHYVKSPDQAITRRPEEGSQLHWRAAMRGHKPSQNFVARQHLEGIYQPKDKLEAYKWFRLSSMKDQESIDRSAAIVSALISAKPNSSAFPRMSASPDLDRLILTMTKEEIEEGERRAMAFRPGPDPGPKIIGLKLNGFVGAGPKRLAIINGKSLGLGESVSLPVAGVKRAVTLREMKDTSVVVAAEGIAQPAELQLSK